MKKIIELKNITKAFDGEPVLQNVNLDIYDNEFITLLGPSGCGKTTMLRLIGGFETPDEGDVLFLGKKINDVPPYKRNVNTVFQKYALFPHLNVFENVAFPLREKKVPKGEIEAKVHEMLSLVALSGFENRAVTRLSGGQQQRVAIARALVARPQVLLLDEPLGALDLKLRKDMQVELKKLQQSLGITFIFVTHDQSEALSMSDRVAVFNNGRIEQVDAPQDLYLHPRTAFVAGFVGTANVFAAEAARRLCGMAGSWSLRPEHVRLQGGGEVQVQGVVQAVQYQGAATRIELRLADGDKLLVSQANIDGAAAASVPRTGQIVQASWSRSAMTPLESGG